MFQQLNSAVSLKDGYYIEYLVIHAPSTSTPEHRSYGELTGVLIPWPLNFFLTAVTFVRQRCGHESSHVEIAVYECYLRLGEEGGEHGVGVDLLAVEFFDDESIVIVYRTSEGESAGRRFAPTFFPHFFSRGSIHCYFIIR